MMKLSPGSFRLGILTPAPNALLRSNEEVRRSLNEVWMYFEIGISIFSVNVQDYCMTRVVLK